MTKILVNTNKYCGQYVALKSVDDNTVVGSGKRPEDALDEARKKGIQAPFLLYIPDENVVHIYYVSW